LRDPWEEISEAFVCVRFQVISKVLDIVDRSLKGFKVLIDTVRKLLIFIGKKGALLKEFGNVSLRVIETPLGFRVVDKWEKQITNLLDSQHPWSIQGFVRKVWS